jgi:hypothetical protein
MHYSINPEEIKAEIEKLGHADSNIWNIKQYKTKFSLSMFSVELKPPQTIRPYMKLNIYNSAKSNSKHPSIKGALHKAGTVNNMGTQKLLPPETKMRKMCW